MMKALTASAAMTFGLLAGAGVAQAQDKPAEPQTAPAQAPMKKWTFELAVGGVSLDEDFAAANQIGDSLFEFGGSAQYWFTPHVAATGSFAFAKMDDHNQSSQLVCPIYDPDCDPEEAESEEIGGSFAAGLEARAPVSENFVLIADGGYKFINFTRAISGCSNCDGGESVNVNGFYAGAGIGIRAGKGLITLRYSQGFGDELGGGMIHLGYQF